MTDKNVMKLALAITILFSFHIFAQVNTGTGVKRVEIPPELKELKNRPESNGYGRSKFGYDGLDVVNHWDDIVKYYQSLNLLFKIDHKCSQSSGKQLLNNAHTIAEVVTFLQLNRLSEFDSDKTNQDIKRNATCNCEEKTIHHRNCIVSDPHFTSIFEELIKSNNFKRAYRIIYSEDHTLSPKNSYLNKEAKDVRQSYKELIKTKEPKK